MANISKCISEAISSVKTDMESMKEDIIVTIKDNTSKMMKEEMGKLHKVVDSKLKCVGAECKKNAVDIENNTKNLQNLLKNSKRKNIIIFGLEARDAWKERRTQVLELFQTTLEVDCAISDIDFTAKLKKEPNSPILVGFISWNMKREILDKRAKLKDTKIFLDEDYTPEVVEKRKKLKAVVSFGIRRCEKCTSEAKHIVCQWKSVGRNF